jgi:hypothetical protein
MRFSTRTFMTDDANGCQFECTAYYGSVVDVQKVGKRYRAIRDNHYVAIGLDVQAATLKELKEKVANL